MAAIVIANLADLCTFYLVVQIHPIAGESNPIVAPLWGVSPWMIVLLKAAGVIVALLLLGRLEGWKGRVGFGLALLVPLLGTLTNTAAGMLG